MIVLLSETVSRLEAQFRLLFFRANERMFLNLDNRVAITDRIQANYVLSLVSSMIILLRLTSVYPLCHQQYHGKHFIGLNAMSRVFQMYKGDISWNCTSNVF